MTLEVLIVGDKRDLRAKARRCLARGWFYFFEMEKFCERELGKNENPHVAFALSLNEAEALKPLKKAFFEKRRAFPVFLITEAGIDVFTKSDYLAGIIQEYELGDPELIEKYIFQAWEKENQAFN